MRRHLALVVVGALVASACSDDGRNASVSENACDELDVDRLDGRFGLSVASTSFEGLGAEECAVDLMDGSSLLISIHDSIPREDLDEIGATEWLDNLAARRTGSIHISAGLFDEELATRTVARDGDRFVRIDRSWDDPEFAPLPDALEPVAEFLLSTSEPVSIAERIDQLGGLPTEFTWECRSFLMTGTGSAQLTLVLQQMSEIDPDGVSTGTALVGIDARGSVNFGARSLDPSAACDDIAVEPSASTATEQAASSLSEQWTVSAARIDYSTTGEGAGGGCVVMVADVSEIVIAAPDGTDIAVPDLVLTNTGFGSHFPDGCRYPDFTSE